MFNFFLVLIGAILIILNVRAIKKEKKSFKVLLKEEEIDITEVEVLIGELRREFSETILEFQKEIIELKEKIDLNQKIGFGQEMDSEQKITLEENITSQTFEKDILLKADDFRELLRQEPSVIYDIENSEGFQSSKEGKNGLSGNNKIKEIGKLLEKGVSIEEICERFDIGKGEILLIKQLYLK